MWLTTADEAQKLAPQPHVQPVGAAVANDGSLLISDDGGNLIYRVWYQAGRR